MSVAARPLFAFDDSFVRELEGLYVPWQGAPVAAPRLLALNEELAAELGADPAALRSDARTISLYVNDYNHRALAVYSKVGFTQVGTFATVLF